MKLKPLDNLNMQKLLISLLQSKITHIKAYINNTPQKDNYETMDLFQNSFKNDTLLSLSLFISNFSLHL